MLVLQPGAGRARAVVQVQDGGGWRTIGSLKGPYTHLSAHDVTAHAVRLLWTAGSRAPVISEVVPRYAAD
ncbi:hypothetical protein CGL27_48225 [Streptomyces sp. 11-1-2]|nr:hypothetical protein CGL27_48225 [Streptomyces sp. 11-1-2]